MQDELEAAILENPDDDSAYLVYADWLLARDDPRGQLIMLQHEADEADGSRKRTLQRSAKALLDQHAAYFLGPLPAVRCTHQLIWRYGYVRRLALEWNEGRRRPAPDALEVLARILQHPSYRFMIDLQIGCIYDEGYELAFQGVIDTLTDLRRPAAVRVLDLGVTGGHRVTTDFGELGELVAALPRLRRIRFRERIWHEPRPDDPVHEINIKRGRKRS